MNKQDSNCVGQILINKGYRQTDSIDEAHIILINTCTVRAKAEEKALTFIGRLSRLKGRKPDLITGVIGCVAQERGINLLKRFPYLDLILGPRNIYQIDKSVSKVKKERERISDSIFFVATEFTQQSCWFPHLKREGTQSSWNFHIFILAS